MTVNYTFVIYCIYHGRWLAMEKNASLYSDTFCAVCVAVG